MESKIFKVGTKQVSPTEIHNCENCYEEFQYDPEKCSICKTELCRKCSQPNEDLSLNEWLVELPNQCSKCRRTGCSECLTTCILCHNIGEDYPVFCKECSDLKSCEGCRECDYCEKHEHCDLCSHYRSQYNKHSGPF